MHRYNPTLWKSDLGFRVCKGDREPGEIACRVIPRCRMGSARGRVSDATATRCTLQRMSGTSRPAAAAESYLRADRLIEAARASGAEHPPGYGFLSGTPTSPTLLSSGIDSSADAGSKFRDFGLKHTARALAARAGVSAASGAACSPMPRRPNTRRSASAIRDLKSSAGAAASACSSSGASRAEARSRRSSGCRAELAAAACSWSVRREARTSRCDLRRRRGGHRTLGERDCSIQPGIKKCRGTPARTLRTMRTDLQRPRKLGRAVRPCAGRSEFFVYDAQR